MRQPLVSIAIPTYNRARKTLSETLRSALAQTYPNLEIIVSDNCSTDDTEAVVRRLGDRIRYVRQTHNVGPNGNLNACIDLATGEYLLLLHDDDLIDPDFVSACMAAIAPGEKVGLIRTGIRIITGDGRVILDRPNLAKRSDSVADLMYAWFRFETAQYCCNTLYNTSALREVGGFHSRHNLFQDALAQVKVAARYGHAHVREAKASWRRHEDNGGAAIRSKLRDWCEDSLEIVEEMCRAEPQHGQRLRRAAMEFFCLTNYDRSAQAPTTWRRLTGYALVARMFHRALSPWPHVYRYDVVPGLRALKRTIVPRRVTGVA